MGTPEKEERIKEKEIQRIKAVMRPESDKGKISE